MTIDKSIVRGMRSADTLLRVSHRILQCPEGPRRHRFKLALFAEDKGVQGTKELKQNDIRDKRTKYTGKWFISFKELRD